jgi:NitT/TauT family transport system substrate-binding protein
MRIRILVPALMAILGLAAPASAADKIRVGKAVAHVFSFVPLDVGMEKGFFAKRNLEVENIAFAGSARLHQGLISDSIDIGLGSGPELNFLAKGEPTTAVANLAGPPLGLGVIVPYDSPIKSIADLKGKNIGISTAGGLTHWMALEMARVNGWGPDGVTPVALGGQIQSQIAGLKTGQVAAIIEATGTALQMEDKKELRLLAPTSSFVKDFMIHTIYATNKAIASNPDMIARFLAGWFDTIAFMYANKAETVAIARKVTQFDQQIEEREYDLVMPMFSRDGKFDPKALAVLARSFVTLKLLEAEPDLSKVVTEKFLPKTVSGS